MHEFIHTFSAVTYLFREEKDMLTKVYHKEMFYNPGVTMKKLFTTEEYKQAMEKLEIILKEIQLSSGVSLWNDTKLRRMDLSKDIITESDVYSKREYTFHGSYGDILLYIKKCRGTDADSYHRSSLGRSFPFKKITEKYIRKYCKTKVSKMEKMLKYRDDCRIGILITGGKVMEYFKETGLSPLCTSKEFPYIPSFSCLLYRGENEMIKAFVERELQKNREHRIS